MLFYEVQLCVQQPSSCRSDAVCCSGNQRAVRGRKGSASAFHLPFIPGTPWGVGQSQERRRVWLIVRFAGGLDGQNWVCVSGFEGV